MTHTHGMITSKMLRSAYACELWQARILRSAFSKSEFSAVKLGIETGIWAVQKVMMLDTM